MNLFTGLLEVTDAGYLLAIKVKQTRMYAGVYRDGPRGFRCTDRLAGVLSGPGACPLEHRVWYSRRPGEREAAAA